GDGGRAVRHDRRRTHPGGDQPALRPGRRRRGAAGAGGGGDGGVDHPGALITGGEGRPLGAPGGQERRCPSYGASGAVNRRHIVLAERRADSAFLSADWRPTVAAPGGQERRCPPYGASGAVNRRHIVLAERRADSAFLSADWRPTVAAPGGQERGCPSYDLRTDESPVRWPGRGSGSGCAGPPAGRPAPRPAGRENTAR